MVVGFGRNNGGGANAAIKVDLEKMIPIVGECLRGYFERI